MKKIASKLVLVALLCSGHISYAQLQAGLNIRTLFSQQSTSPDNLIFKYQYQDLPVIPRLKLGYSGNYSVNQHIFHEEKDYMNLEYWPSDVEKDGYNQTRSYSITPGFEYRFTQKNTYWYVGAEVSLNQTTFDNVFSWHGEYNNGGTPKYTISNVRQNKTMGTQTSISPMALFGFGYNITDRITIFGEALAGPTFNKYDNEYESVYYNWNGLALTFDKQEQPNNDWVMPDPVWQRNTVLNPMLNFYVAYRFTGRNELN